MEITISNKIYIKDFSNDLLNWAEKNLTIVNPKWQTLKRIGKEETIIRCHIPEYIKIYSIKGKTLTLPFGCLYGIWKFIKSEKIDLKLNDSDYEISNKNIPTRIELYDYQKEAINNMVLSKGGVLVSPCGSGKTVCGIEIIHSIGKRFLWLTHTGDLLRQTRSRMKSLYPELDIGLITEGEINIGKDGCIATVQTLANVDIDEFKDYFEVIVVDECAHVSGAPTLVKMFQKILDSIPARYKYGLTATPTRSDTMIKAMYAYIGLSKNGEFEPTYKVNKDNVKTMVALHEKIDIPFDIDFSILNSDGTFDYYNLINYISNNSKRNDIILDNICKCQQEGRKQVVLCQLVSHCETMHKKLLERGIKSELVIGKTKNKERERVLNNPEEWDVIVSTYKLLKEGVDVKALDTLHLCTPQKDKATVVQCVGRIERLFENKKQPIVYDYVDIKIPYCERKYIERKRNIDKRY